MRRTQPTLSLLAFFFGAAVVSACDLSFEPYGYVRALSVIAIAAEPPEAAPGQSSTVTALVHDPAGRTIDRAWAACTLAPVAGTGDDVNPRCVTEAEAPFLVPAGADERATVTMPLVSPLDLGLPDFTDGFYLPVRLVVRADAARVTAFYRLRYGLFPASANRNPVIEDLHAASAPLADGTEVARDAEMKMRVVYAEGSVEKFQVVDQGATSVEDLMSGDRSRIKFLDRTEQLRTRWLATAGAFDPEVTNPERPETTWKLKEKPPSAPGPVHLWVVVRDDRGGVAWTHRTLTLKP